MINDSARLMNDMNVVTSIISPDINEMKLMLRLEEILTNYDIKRKTALDIEDDTAEKVNMFLSAKRLEGLSQLTLDGYLIELRMFHGYVDKATVLITTPDIRSFLASNRIWAVGTVDKKLSVLKSFFSWLVGEELLLRDPTVKIKSPKKPKRLPNALTVEELEIVRESCKSLRERAFVEVMYSTGCRLDEIANMRISSINHQDRSLKIIGKGNKERIVLFSFKAMHHLNKYLNTRKNPLDAKCDYMFTRDRRPYTKLSNGAIGLAVTMIGKRVKISRNLTPHVFRHSAATHMMEAGADLADVQDMLGHEDASTTQIYARVSEERKRFAHRRFHVQ